MTLTARQTEVLAAYVKWENQQVVADVLGITLQTMKNHLHTAYRELDVTNIIGAAKAMGWLEVGE